MTYACSCGYRFDYALGKYGCPNCLGEGKVRLVKVAQSGGNAGCRLRLIRSGDQSHKKEERNA